MLAPSLLEGNTTVFKPSEETPEIGQRLVQLFAAAGFPAGTINLVHGLGDEAGDALARHDGVDVVAFTGSYQVGSHIRKLAAESDHKTCACEMGSKDAVIVCEDASLIWPSMPRCSARSKRPASAACRPAGCWCIASGWTNLPSGWSSGPNS